MNTRVLLAALAGTVASFLMSYLLFEVALKDYYQSMMNPDAKAFIKDPPVMWAFVASSFAWSLMLALVYNRWAGISTLRAGAIAGAIISFLVVLSFDLGMYGYMNVWTDTVGLIVDPLVNAVMGAVVGGAVGWALGFRSGSGGN